MHEVTRCKQALGHSSSRQCFSTGGLYINSYILGTQMLPKRQTNPINRCAKCRLIWGETVSQIGQETCIICVQPNARHTCPHLLLCEVCELIGIFLSDVGLECWRIMGPGGSCFIPLHDHHIIPANKKLTFPHNTLPPPPTQTSPITFCVLVSLKLSLNLFFNLIPYSSLFTLSLFLIQ